MTFGPVTAMTLTGASLASAASRQGTAIGPINGSPINIASPVDVQLQVKLTSGTTGTSATGVVNIYVATSTDGTNYSDNATGPDGAITPTVPPNSTLLFQLNVVANSTAYETPMMSLAQKLGSVPNYFNVFLTNASGHALGAAATVVEYTIVY